MKNIVVLGASPKAGRFAHQALVKLSQAGYQVLPVHPNAKEIEGIPVFAALELIDQPVDTVTLYVGPARLVNMVDEVCRLQPKRVIFNPGTEDKNIQEQFEVQGIQCVCDCTLVMLDQNRF